MATGAKRKLLTSLLVGSCEGFIRRHEVGEGVAGDEVAIARAGVTAPWQVRAAIGGVVDADGDLPGEQALDAEVPLEDVGVVRFFGAEVVAVVVAP